MIRRPASCATPTPATRSPAILRAAMDCGFRCSTHDGFGSSETTSEQDRPMAGKERGMRRAATIDVAASIPKLTLRQLGYFLAAANHQSVGKAAQALNVSAPSVSMAI